MSLLAYDRKNGYPAALSVQQYLNKHRLISGRGGADGCGLVL
jgi:hypothetical protein